MKKILFLLAFAVSVCVLADNVPLKPDGDGSPEKPFLISRIEHLVWMGKNIEENAGKCYLMTADIDASETKSWNNSRGFLPIGYVNEKEKAYSCFPFRGSFDGGGHTISNLFIDRKEQPAALFARIGTPLKKFDFSTNVLENIARSPKAFATVKDLALVNCDFFGKDLAAGLACNIDFALIKRVYVSGVLKSEKNVAGFAMTCNNSCLEECEADIEFKNRYCNAAGCFFSSQNTVLKNYLSKGSFQYSSDYYDQSRVSTGYSARTYRKAGRSKKGPDLCTIAILGGGDPYLKNCLVLNSLLTDRRKSSISLFPRPENVLNSFYSGENVKETLNDNNKIGISNEKLKRKETYKGWDFENVWEMEDGMDYPKLRNIEKMLKRK